MRQDAAKMQQTLAVLNDDDPERAKYAEEAKRFMATKAPVAAAASPAAVPAAEQPKGRRVYEDKEEGKAAFKELLEEKNVGTTWTWDVVMRGIISDDRYSALKTNGEKKAALSEYQADKVKRVREEKREMERNRRNAFVEMLREAGSKIESKTRFRDAFMQLGVDPRWRAVADKRDQENLFEDYLKEVETREREQATIMTY